MRYMLMAVLMLVMGAGAGAAEAASAADGTKAERIAKVKYKIATDESTLKRCTPEYIANMRKNGGEGNARGYELAVKKATARLPLLRLELRWLSGEVTVESAGKEVKVAEETLAKAPDAEKAKAQATLDAAKKELETIRDFESAESAKANKGEF